LPGACPTRAFCWSCAIRRTGPSPEYRHGVAKGHIACSFRDHIHASLRDTGGLFRPTYPVLQFGDYAAQLRRYLSHFPPSQLHIAFYQDYQRAPEAFFRGVLEFLGVDPAFVPDTSRRYRVFAAPRPVVFDPDDRRFLIGLYHDGIRDLERLTGRDLCAWRSI
jgi:hypothetical protein